MTEGFLESRGIAYRASAIWPGRKSILFIHGLSGSCSAWYRFEAQFEEKYNVITFDLRGHGLSARPRSYAEYALEESVADIHELLQTLKVYSPTVVSHSFGTPIAMEYLRAYGGERALFLAPPYSPHSILLVQLLKPLLFVASILASVLPHPRGARTDYTKYTPAGDWSLNRIAADIYHMGLRSYLCSLRQLYAINRDAHWQELQIPTLIVHGTNDTLVPIAQAQALAKALPHATVREVAGANHILPLNNKNELVAAIEEFVG